MEYSKSVIAVPPGETMREQLESRGMTQKEFAIRMDLSEKHVSRLINGKVELTHDVALRLESVLGIPAAFWNNLESCYREQLARVHAENQMEEEQEIARHFPYAKMAALHWVERTRNLSEKAKNLRSFFRVAKLSALEDLAIPGIAYRTLGDSCERDYALAAWTQKARLIAEDMEVSPINVQKLYDSVSTIRSLTNKCPEEFCPELKSILSDCGIAIVFLPHIGGSFLHGATFVDRNHIVLGLTVRGRDADRFWFSLFHELFHILDGHIFDAEASTPEKEHAADIFSRDTLITKNDFERLVKKGAPTRENIQQFAKDIGIAPGIVVGRLQKENIIPFNRFNDLKDHYTISS